MLKKELELKMQNEQQKNYYQNKPYKHKKKYFNNNYQKQNDVKKTFNNINYENNNTSSFHYDLSSVNEKKYSFESNENTEKTQQINQNNINNDLQKIDQNNVNLNQNNEIKQDISSNNTNNDNSQKYLINKYLHLEIFTKSFGIFFFLLLTLLGLAGIITILVFYLDKHQINLWPHWLYLIPLTIIFFIILIVNIIKLKKVIYYLKNNNGLNFFKQYLVKLLISNINIHWVALYIYLLGGLFILFMFVATYIYNGSVNFGDIHIGTINNSLYNLPYISIIATGCLMGSIFVFQVINTIVYFIKKHRIISIYSYDVVDYNYRDSSVRATNKRNGLILLALTIVFFIIFAIILIIIKFKKK